jgi:hypothetical protein
MLTSSGPGREKGPLSARCASLMCHSVPGMSTELKNGCMQEDMNQYERGKATAQHRKKRCCKSLYQVN